MQDSFPWCFWWRSSCWYWRGCCWADKARKIPHLGCISRSHKRRQACRTDGAGDPSVARAANVGGAAHAGTKFATGDSVMKLLHDLSLTAALLVAAGAVSAQQPPAADPPTPSSG